MDRTQRSHHHRDRVFHNRHRVRVRGMDHADPSRFARVEIDVVQSNAGACDDFEIGCSIEELLIDFGVGPDDERLSTRDEFIESSIARCALDKFAAITEPLKWLGCKGFGHNREWGAHVLNSMVLNSLQNEYRAELLTWMR